MTRPRAADDFPTIRARMKELRRERAPRAADDFAAIPEDRMDWTDFVQRPVQGFRRTARGDLASPQAGGRGH